MADKQFEKLKADFLEKNRRFADAVGNATSANYMSARGRFELAALHHKAALSYTALVTYVKRDRFTNANPTAFMFTD